jgi:cytochrome c peroxidase
VSRCVSLIGSPALRVACLFTIPLGLAAVFLRGEKPPARTVSTAKVQPVSLASVGRKVFFDKNLSSPSGVACATCHAPSAGWTNSNSQDNLLYGVSPGAVSGRFGNRNAPTVSYAALIPPGPPAFDPTVSAFVGGLFWDGRANDLADQATFPLQNPNEMNNISHNLGDPAMVVQEASRGAIGRSFRRLYEDDVFSRPTADVFDLITAAIAAFEQTPEVSPFTSKYDAYLLGKVKLSPAEMEGLRLVTGSETGRPGGPPHAKSALCVACHGIPSDPSQGPDLWTNTCYANIGVPRNPGNPYYRQTNAVTDPLGYNPDGLVYIDLGLGGSYYPTLGLPPGNLGPNGDGRGDFLAIDGTFKAPTLRNAGKSPGGGFVKAYLHNGAFKSLKQVVHFYNTRNLTTVPGEVIDFTLRGVPLWNSPEFLSPDTLQNPSGLPGSAGGQVGNIGLTNEEEDDIVAFINALSDGYFQRE